MTQQTDSQVTVITLMADVLVAKFLISGILCLTIVPIVYGNVKTSDGLMESMDRHKWQVLRKELIIISDSSEDLYKLHF